MKLLKILGIIVGVLAVSAGGAWAAFVRAPSEAEICSHLETLMEKKAPGFATTPPGKEFKASCPKKVAKGELEGAVPYAKRAKCVIAAESIEAVESCDR